MHLLFTLVHFLFWQPGRVVGQYATKGRKAACVCERERERERDKEAKDWLRRTVEGHGLLSLHHIFLTNIMILYSKPCLVLLNREEKGTPLPLRNTHSPNLCQLQIIIYIFTPAGFLSGFHSTWFISVVPFFPQVEYPVKESTITGCQRSTCNNFTLRSYRCERHEPNYFPTNYGWIVGQTDLFNVGMATSLREGKLWIENC